jgi:hypothetical protein
MAVDYTEATPVDVDDGVFSQDYNRLALAFNDRLKNGVGDPTWRLLWYAHSLVRGMRNPNGFLYAAEDEWWKVYSHIKEASGITWPTTSAGMPEGVNVANPLGAFIYGLAPTVVNEEGRVSGSGEFDPAGTPLATAPTGVPLFLSDGGLHAPANIADYWTLSKYQRGAVPSDLSDYSASNAIKASQEHGFINYPSSGFFLQNYGGFLPSPKLDASDPICDDGYTPNLDLKFKALNSSVADKTYTTCQPHGVMFYFEGFSAYKIIKWNGSTESLPLTDYLEGPYTDNAYLRRYKGQQLNEVMNWYAMEYRANETEREESDMNRINKGFQFQDFLTRQYCLAPAYGTVSTGSITAVYPTFTASTGEVAGTYIDVLTAGVYSGTTTYTVPTKFTYAAFYAKTTGSGAGDVEIEAFNGSTSLTTFTITAVGGSTVDHMEWFTSAHNEADIRFKLKTTLPANVTINIECAMLLEYKPTIYDAYVCLRLGSTDGPTSTTYDKSGYTFSDPKQISDNILGYGCLIRGVAGIPTADAINENPVYESARRLIHNNLRMAERQSLVGYEVIGGKSYLHFKRFARGQYSGDLDVFEGIAPPSAAVASGDLIEGEVYQVWSAGGSGTIDYSSTTYNPITSAGSSGGEMAGTFFTATSVKTFTASGDAKVRVRNGIRSVPIKDNRDDRFRGQTNEWTTQQTTNVYKLSDSSIYKADAYGDIMGFLTDRCGLLSCDWSRMNCTTGFADRAEVNRQVNYGAKMSLRPENPSGYRYVLGSHSATGYRNDMVQAENDASTGEGDKRHYESCQIYKPDNGIEAVYIDPTSYYAGSDYDVIVKLTGRLENETSPTTVTNSSSGWYAAFTGSYVPERRTDENAVLEYLYHIASYGSGSITNYNCIQKIGDVAYDATTSSGYWGNDFHGNCYPRFYFSKAVRHVWNDTNASYDAADSLTTVDEMLYMEFILQAISSGFIDKESTLQFSCTDENRLYDYTFPNLCYQALKQGKTELEYKGVTRATDTYSWESEANVLYSLVGVDGSGNETLFASSVESPYTKTGVSTSFTSYRAYAGSNNENNRTILDFTLTYTGANNDNVITFTESSAAYVRYYIMGRTHTSGNTNDWEYYTGAASTPWSSDEADALNASSPRTIDYYDAKDEYRVEAVVYGKKRWFEFLPATLRPDNAQGFGPLPNTNLYSRIFNNLCNAVNLLTRARVDLPFNYQTRDGEKSWLGTPVTPDDTAYDASVTTDIAYPIDYGCTVSEGGTLVARLSGSIFPWPNFDPLNAEASGSYGGAAVTDRALGTAGSGWTNGGSTDSTYDVGFASPSAACGGGVVTGMAVSGSSFSRDGDDWYKPYILSSKFKGEIRITPGENVHYALPNTWQAPDGTIETAGIRDLFAAKPSFLGALQHVLSTWEKDSTGDYIYSPPLVQVTANKYLNTIKTLHECAIYEGDVTIDAADSPLYGAFTGTEGDFYYNQVFSTINRYESNGNYLSLNFQPYTDKPMFIKIPTISRSYPNNTY